MGGSYCPLAIRMSWEALDKIDQGSKDDKEWLHKTFSVCGDMKDTIATDLSNWLQSIWFNMGMGMLLAFILYVLVVIVFSVANYPYPASFLEPLPAWPVKVHHLSSSLIKYFTNSAHAGSL